MFQLSWKEISCAHKNTELTKSSRGCKSLPKPLLLQRGSIKNEVFLIFSQILEFQILDPHLIWQIMLGYIWYLSYFIVFLKYWPATVQTNGQWAALRPKALPQPRNLPTGAMHNPLATAATLVSSAKKLRTKRELVCHGCSGAPVKPEVAAGRCQWWEGRPQGLCTDPSPFTQEHPRQGLRVLSKPTAAVCREDGSVSF